MKEPHNFTEFKLPLSLGDRPFRSHHQPPRFSSPRTQAQRQQYAGNVRSAFYDRILPTVLSSSLIQPELIFKIPSSTNTYINQRELEERHKFSILENSNNGTVVIFSTPEAVQGFIEKVQSYSNTFRENDRYNPFETFGIPMIITEDERIGNSLNSAPLIEDLEEVDIFLWYFGSGTEILQQTQAILNIIIQKIRELNGIVDDSLIIEEYVIIKAKINNLILNILKREPCVRIIERAIVFQNQSPVQLMTDDPEFQFLEPVSDFGILVLDEAILPGNRFVAKAIQEYHLNSSLREYEQDQISHGTAVSCFALYGDLFDIINSTKQFQPIGKLYFGSIWDPNRNIFSNIREELEYFLNQYPNIRVVNICMASENVINTQSWKQMPLAGMLDHYQLELATQGKDIIFVISMGNFGYLLYGRINQYYRNFKNIVHDIQENKIVDPASSALSLTIGSICIGENIPATYYNESSLCREFYPSPCSRVGPSVGESFKPDFVEFGSDSIQLAAHSAEEQPTGILTINSVQYGPFTFDEGTSFAAPIVTHKIAQLWQSYPDLHSNSIKALLAIGSEFHKNFLGFFDLNRSNYRTLRGSNQEKILNLFGYGRIDIEKSRFSDKNWVVLLQERQLQPNQFDLFDIPIPNEFFSSRGQKKITIVISYNPPTKASRKDYLGIELDYFIVKNVPNELLTKYYEKGISRDREEDISDQDYDEQEDEDEQEDDNTGDEETDADQRSSHTLSISDLLELDLNDREQRKLFTKNIRKYQIKVYPSKEMVKKNCIKKHIQEFTRRTSPPDENGYKILLYAKYSQTKWFKSESDRSFRQPYSIVVGLECQSDIELRSLVRSRLHIPIQQRINV